MKLDEVLDPREFAIRLNQTSGERPVRISKLIDMLKAKSKSNNPRRDDPRHHDEEEGVDPDLKTLPTG